VVAPEHVKGYIYVEAYKQTHVKQAIEGVGNLRMGYWNQQMVPIKEMTDVLKVVKEVTNLKPKSWVRLKRGIYKDDIAQVRSERGRRGGGEPPHPAHPTSAPPKVDYVEPSQNQISLKMIPRIDFDRIKARMSLVRGSVPPPPPRRRRPSLTPCCPPPRRKTGSPRGRSSSGPRSGSSTPRRSGRRASPCRGASDTSPPGGAGLAEGRLSSLGGSPAQRGGDSGFIPGPWEVTWHPMGTSSSSRATATAARDSSSRASPCRPW